jgi:hypothetical protein
MNQPAGHVLALKKIRFVEPFALRNRKVGGKEDDLSNTNVAGVVEVASTLFALDNLQDGDGEPPICFCRLSIPFLPFPDEAPHRFVSAAMLSTDSCSLVTLLLSASEGADAGSGTEEISDDAAPRERGEVKLRFKAGEQPFSVSPIQRLQGRWRELSFW